MPRLTKPQRAKIDKLVAAYHAATVTASMALGADADDPALERFERAEARRRLTLTRYLDTLTQR